MTIYYPTVQIFEWDITEGTSPNGTRNVYGGHPAFVKELGETVAKAMEFEDVILDFTSSISGVYNSRVQAFTVGLNNNDFSISSLRLWMPSGTALNSSGHLEFTSSGLWIPNAHLPSGIGTVMPTVLPTSPNIMNQNSMSWSLDSGADDNVSQYVYLGLSVPSGMPLGQYGLGVNGHLALRVTYDWYWKFNSSGSQT